VVDAFRSHSGVTLTNTTDGFAAGIHSDVVTALDPQWPVPAQRVGRLILVDEPIGKAGLRAVTRIVAEHWDRFCRLGSDYVEAALAAQGRELVVVDSAEVDDDPVWGMTGILTGMCARPSKPTRARAQEPQRHHRPQLQKPRGNCRVIDEAGD
jgi:hypothetical protein